MAFASRSKDPGAVKGEAPVPNCNARCTLKGNEGYIFFRKIEPCFTVALPSPVGLANKIMMEL